MNKGVVSLVSLAEELEEYIQELVPKSETVKKYGGTLFTLRPEEKEGQFCGVFIQKQNVQISFSRGAELKDPGKILLGSGKKRRHINYASSAEVDYAELKKLIRQASKLQA